MSDIEPHNDNTLNEIEQLLAKREQAQILLTRYSTQLEAITSEHENLVKKLETDHGVSVDNIQSAVETLRHQRDELLNQAKSALSKINL